MAYAGVGEIVLIDDSNTDDYLELYSTSGYAVQSHNLESLPERVVSAEKSPGDSDSAWFDAGWSHKVVNLVVVVLASSRSDMKAKFRTLKRFLLKDWIRIYQTSNDRYLRVKPTNIDMPETTEARSLKATLSMEFLAPMPWQLPNNSVVQSFTAVTTSPLPIVFDNPGDIHSYPVITIENPSSGDLSNLSITDVNTGDFFTFTGTIPAGSTLVIDSLTRTVELDDEDYIGFVEGNEWMKVESGGNSYTVEFTSSGDMNLDFEYTPRYV